MFSKRNIKETASLTLVPVISILHIEPIKKEGKIDVIRSVGQSCLLHIMTLKDQRISFYITWQWLAMSKYVPSRLSGGREASALCL